MKRQGKQRGQNSPVRFLEEDWSCLKKKKKRNYNNQIKQEIGRNQKEKDKLDDKIKNKKKLILIEKQH